LRARLAPQRLHEAVTVEPAFAAAPPTPGGEILGRQPGKARGKAVAIEESDVRTQRSLQRMIRAQDRFARWCREEEVAAFLEADLRPFAVDRQGFAEPAQKLDAVERQLHVHGRRKLLADRCGRQCRGGARIARIGFEHENAQSRRKAQMIGDGRTNRRPAGHHHVEGLGHAGQGSALKRLRRLGM
jgi:hypothetical protein